MLDQQTLIHAIGNTDHVDNVSRDAMMHLLSKFGFCLIRGYTCTLGDFSRMIGRLCSEITYDPARAVTAKSIQSVDAGVEPVGLHIENGNTPRVPHLVGFYCRRAAEYGSQTTVCDGIELLAHMPNELRAHFTGSMQVCRTLSETQWRSYLAQEHPLIDCADQVTVTHLEQMLAQFTNLEASLNPNGSLQYRLEFEPVIESPFSCQPAFANAILGPSFNYEAPDYLLPDGERLCGAMRESLKDYAERYTQEIAWQSGDVLLVDNWRIMHGRRRILDEGNRELFIGMGMV